MLTKNFNNRLDKLERHLNMDSEVEVQIFIDLENGSYMSYDGTIISQAEYERIPADTIINIGPRDDDDFIY